MKGALRLASALALAVFVASCGGGGGGSGASGSTGGGSAVGDTGSVPSDPPPIPEAAYSGATGTAAVSDTNAATLGTEMLTMLQTTAAFAYNAPPSIEAAPDQTINKTQAGPLGGQLVTQGQVKNGAGWIVEDYQNYVTKLSDGEIVTYDGEIELRYGDPTATGATLTIGFLGTALTVGSDSATLTGSIKVLLADASKINYIADFSIYDSAADQYLKADFQITGDNADVNGNSADIFPAGRFYDSRLGYVDMQTASALVFQKDVGAFDGTHWPFTGGPITLSGGGAGDIVVAPLNLNFAYIGIDANGDGLADEGTRIDWPTLSVDTTATPQDQPEANAWQFTRAMGTGQPVQLSGRFSHDPAGTMLHYQWTLALAPAGSTAQLQNAASAMPSFTPDVPGDYLLRLTVSDAAGSGTDSIAVDVPDYQTKPGDPAPAERDGYNAGGDRVGSINVPVALDARASKNLVPGLTTPDATYAWHLYTPPGSQAVLSDPNAVQPTFTPDVPGYYYATLDASLDISNPHADVTVAVGEPLHFDHYAAVVNLPYSIDAFAVGDLNGDGLPDIAFAGLSADGTTGLIDVVYNKGGGHFAPPIVVTAGNAKTIAIGDINGDGRNDLTAGAADGFDYVLQQADGTLGPVGHKSFSTACSVWYPAIAIARLFGQTRNSVIEADNCDAGMEIFPPDPAGTVGAGWPQATLGKSAPQIVAADVTGDGIMDIVSDNWAAPTGTLQAAVFAGQSEGTFAAEVDYPGTPTNLIEYPLAVADFNGDGRNDVGLFAWVNGKPGMDMFYQTSTGTLAAAQFMPSADGPDALLAGDINNDGRADLTMLHSYLDASDTYRVQLGIYLQQADGTLSAEQLYPMRALQNMMGPAPQYDIVDINGDGIADIVYYQNNELRIRLGDPLGRGASVSRYESRMQPGPARLKPLGLTALRAARGHTY